MAYQKRGEYEGRRILTNLQNGGKWNEIIKYCNRNALSCIQSQKLEEGLDVHLRSDCVHVYYKGGRILEIKTDVLNIDPNYFYLKRENNNIPRTHMELIRDGNWKELKKRHVSYKEWTKEKAKVVFDNLLIRRNELFGINRIATDAEMRKAYIVSAEKPEDYFNNAKEVMDKWSKALEEDNNVTHGERLLQQKISLANKNPKETDFIVIDIEFSVSNAEDCPFRSEDVNYQTHPRFDIIAVQPKNNYKLAVIELKRGRRAAGITDDDTFEDEIKSGVNDHVHKFDATVGNDKGYVDFVKEMQGVLNMKVKLGILPKELEGVEIPLEKPKFLLAYAGESKEGFKSACDKARLNCLFIEDEEYPLLIRNED